MPIELGPLPSQQDGIIFVVESDEVVRSALHFILDDQNETHSFASLEPALANTSTRTPNVILLGIGMVLTNGERKLAEIAARLPGVRILIVADTVSDPLAVACLGWGAHGVLGKPISFDSVRRRVDGLLRPRALSPALLGLLPLSAAW
jgi:DNA-binding response OmpR family regulator